MSLKDVCFKCLEVLEKPVSRTEITDYINKNDLYDFGNTQRPGASVSAQLGNFIRKGDVRVSRYQGNDGVYLYYLTKNEQTLKFDIQHKAKHQPTQNTSTSFYERDLHILLSTFLSSKNIHTKTIFHEQNNQNDKNQIWTNPDIVGVEFAEFSDTTEQFLKVIDTNEMFKLYSYEIKRELNSDNELKKAYFQAVSNSSWANYGYLVAFNINTNLHKEIQRLNKSFGIGVIELSSNIYESKIIATSRVNNLDFDTINKLSNTNEEFRQFIEKTKSILSNTDHNNDTYVKFQLENFCDKTLENDEIEDYCNDKNIPIENDEEL